MKIRFSIPVLAVLFAAACNNNDSQATDNDNTEDRIAAPVLLSYQVLNKFPHDSLSYTEGLSFFNGQLYESTGSPDEPPTNNTWVGPVDLQTGKYQKKVDMGTTYFGEGVTFLHDKMFQLTYKSETGFIYDAKTFKKTGTFRYKGEGWGFTNDGKSLIMSNGTYNLYYLDPDSLTFTRMLAVQDNNGYDTLINELEYIDGYIYANQWLTPYILKIDPKTGYVVAKLDLSRITNEIKANYPDAQEMNGIAYDSVTKKTYITGKKWPFIYQISW